MAETPSGEATPYLIESTSSKIIPSSNRYSILLFCIVNFLWWISLYLYVPILPVFIQTTGANLNVVGTVLSAYAIP
ncbi:MAG: hypothetical protein MUO19_09100, partial [Dehalococcoidales bacterium]|nr:hypothetical protein [Dehalococcoidales bacterium]